MALNKAKKTAIIVSSATLVLGVAINVLALGVFADQITERIFGYDVDSTQQAQNREEGEALAEKIVTDGVVLLKNEPFKKKSDVLSLPLSKEDVKKVNVFGWASVQWVYGPTGTNSSAAVGPENDKPEENVDFLKSFGV